MVFKGSCKKISKPHTSVGMEAKVQVDLHKLLLVKTSHFKNFALRKRSTIPASLLVSVTQE